MSKESVLSLADKEAIKIEKISSLYVLPNFPAYNTATE